MKVQVRAYECSVILRLRCAGDGQLRENDTWSTVTAVKVYRREGGYTDQRYETKRQNSYFPMYALREVLLEILDTSSSSRMASITEAADQAVLCGNRKPTS